MSNNSLYLSGEVVSMPKFTHSIIGEDFYEINLKVKRLSEQYDILPVTVSDRLMADSDFSVGNTVSVVGQFRSYNKLENDRSRLMLTVFVREVVENDPYANPNHISLSGFICKPPVFRVTPFKREIADLLIAVNRAYNKSDYIPCIAWGRNARFVRGMDVGEKVTVTGRIQSREYQKTIGEETTVRIAYEVSVNKVAVMNGYHDTPIDDREAVADDNYTNYYYEV